MIQQVQGTVVSTREPQVQRTTTTESTSIQVAVANRVLSNVVTDTGIRIPNRGDPVAQAVYIDQEDGLFVTSIDVFFATKSSSLPVTMQLRTMVNGYPTTTLIPFGTITKQAADISTSTDGTTATTFTFPSPVYLQNATEYCFVMPCATPDYTIYTAR